MKFKKAILVVSILTIIAVATIVFAKKRSEEIIKQKEEEVLDHLEFDDDSSDYDIEIIEESNDDIIEELNDEPIVNSNDIVETQKIEYDGDETIDFDEGDDEIEQPSEKPIIVSPEDVKTNEKKEVIIAIDDGNNSTDIIPD